MVVVLPTPSFLTGDCCCRSDWTRRRCPPVMMFRKAVTMARINRRMVLSETEIQVVHCTNRCVRRANLCGLDPVTGRDLEHRRQWIRDRLAFLAGLFAIDVLSYAVTGNQFHVILRSRPDVAREWKEDEVAIRWWQLFPQRRTREGDAAEPAEMDLKVLVARSAELRLRLSSVSWFMLCIRGHRQMGKRGRPVHWAFLGRSLQIDTAFRQCSCSWRNDFC